MAPRSVYRARNCLILLILALVPVSGLSQATSRLSVISNAAAGMAESSAQAVEGLPVPGDTVIVVADNNYPPYVFISEGELKGIVPDQWKEWEKATGIKVDLRGMDWANALAAIEDGGADVIDTIFVNDERLAIYDFTSAYAKLDVPVFMHTSISGISSISDLRGFKVAVKTGDTSIIMLREAGIVDLVEYPSYESIIDAAVRLDVRVFCIDAPPAQYLLYKAGVDKDFRVATVLYSGEFHRAVLKTRPGLGEFVQAGFDGIPVAAIEAIDRKWFGTPLGFAQDPRFVYIAGGAVLGVLLVLGYLAYDSRRLRRKIAAATGELRDKVLLLKASEARAVGALAEKDILLREVHHRVKNNMQVMSSLVALEEDLIRDELDRVEIHEMQRRIRSMARVHEILYESNDFASIDVGEYLDRMIRELSSAYAFEGIVLAAEPVRISLDKAMPVALVAHELVTNAIKYAYPGLDRGAVRVRVSRRDGGTYLSVSDDGAGPPAGIELSSAKSMGFVLVKSLALQLYGPPVISREGGFTVEVRME